MNVTEVEGSNRYQYILSFENDAETRERYIKEAKALAFIEHLHALGREQDVQPRLAEGDTRISIPSFFRLKPYKDNPINQAALDLLPKFSYAPGYGDTTDVRVNGKGIDHATRMISDELAAARRGRIVEFIVARVLSLDDPEVNKAYTNAYHPPRDSDFPRHSFDIRFFIGDVVRDLNKGVVSEVSDVAAMVKEAGYADFLDYLIDQQQIIDGRVDTIFSTEAQLH